MHQIKGEKPCDEMRRKGLGEEPSVAFNEGQKHCGWKLGDVYVLELFCRHCEIDQEHETKRFHAMASDKSSKRSEGRVILEADLSNKGEVQFLLSFIRLKAN